MLLPYNEEIKSNRLHTNLIFMVQKKTFYWIQKEFLTFTLYNIWVSYSYLFKNVFFFSQEYGINYAIRDVIYTVCELNFKLIFQIRNYIKKSTHAIIINPSLIQRRCSSSLCWCAVFCPCLEIVALLGEYSIKNIQFCRFPLLFSFIWKIN